MKKALAAAAIGLCGLAAIPAQAMQIAPLSASAPYVTLVAGGCGIGFHRGPYGGCRPKMAMAWWACLAMGMAIMAAMGMAITAAIAMVEVIATVGPIAMGAVVAAITMALTAAIITITITITDATTPLPALAYTAD